MDETKSKVTKRMHVCRVVNARHELEIHVEAVGTLHAVYGAIHLLLV